MSDSFWERVLDCELRSAKLTGYEREYRFHASRRWLFDFAWPEEMLAVEVEGGVWSGGRHVRGEGFEHDCEKYNAAVLDGWRVVRFTSAQIERGKAIPLIRRLLHTTSSKA